MQHSKQGSRGNLDNVITKLHSANTRAHVGGAGSAGNDESMDLYDVLESVESSLRMIAFYYERRGLKDGLFNSEEVEDRFGVEL